MADDPPKPTCFVIMPITVPKSLLETYGGDAQHFHHVYDHLLKPAVEAAGFVAQKPVSKGSTLIHADIIRSLRDADLVLADMSILNANVFFELGVRTSLNLPACFIKDDVTGDAFDTRDVNYEVYRAALNPWELGEDIAKIAAHIRATVEQHPDDNALWHTFGIRAVASLGTDATPEQAQRAVLLDEVRALRHGLERVQDEIERNRVTSRRDLAADEFAWRTQEADLRSRIEADLAVAVMDGSEGELELVAVQVSHGARGRTHYRLTLDGDVTPSMRGEVLAALGRIAARYDVGVHWDRYPGIGGGRS